MRFLADENFPAPSMRALRAGGHDVLAVAELVPSATDLAILELATSEDRVLLTFDRDFGELAVRLGRPAPAGIILLRFTPGSPGEPGVRLLNLLADTAVTISARLTILEREGYRQRSLPREVREMRSQYVAVQSLTGQSASPDASILYHQQRINNV